jgi:hypothetical protein
MALSKRKYEMKSCGHHGYMETAPHCHEFWANLSYRTDTTNSLRTGGDFRTQKLPKTFKIVKTYMYWHDHSLESSWGALSDGTISFQPFNNFRGKSIFWIFLKKPQSLMRFALKWTLIWSLSCASSYSIHTDVRPRCL